MRNQSSFGEIETRKNARGKVAGYRARYVGQHGATASELQARAGMPHRQQWRSTSTQLSTAIKRSHRRSATRTTPGGRRRSD